MTGSDTPAPRLAVEFATPQIELQDLGSGVRVLRSTQPLAEAARQVGVWLRHWSEAAPDRRYLAERRSGETVDWTAVTFGEARAQVDALSSWLLDRGLSPERPIAILSDNSIDSALLQLAAIQIGVPVAPISPAYSLLSSDHAKLRQCLAIVDPGLIYADDGEMFGPALASVDASVEVLHSVNSPERPSVCLRDLFDTPLHPGLDAAFDAVGPKTIAKFLFTSGSTGAPKAVINTQAMLCSNQAAIAQAWPFLLKKPQVMLDWLPWSHTFGGNFNFFLMLSTGGTLYIDGGKPAPHLLSRTVRNLREVSPTLYFNVPKGFGMLLPHLERDAELAGNFFKDLSVIFYGAAALPQDQWERLEALSLRERGARVTMTAGWGATETGPMATVVHYPIERAGVIGVPVPGVEIKLAPNGSKEELLVRGPNVTPGYWKAPELTAAAFDEDGFYRIGDAGKLEAPSDPNLGIRFDGRVAEDFKLLTGVFVNVGKLRVEALAHTEGVLADAVLCGHDTEYVSLLGIPDLARVTELTQDLPADAGMQDRLEHSAVREALKRGLAHYNAAHQNSSERVRRVLLLAEPLSIDAGEITDKGYVNQRAVREHRPEAVAALYDDDAPNVIWV